MKYLIAFTLLLAFQTSNAASVYLETKSGGTYTAISGIALTELGLEVHVNGLPVCLVSNELLRINNVSGLDLVERLTDERFDYVLECRLTKAGELRIGNKIRPRME